MNELKSLKKFTCTICLEVMDVMSSKDEDLNFKCGSCVWKARTKDEASTQLDGAPRGYVRGSRTPVKQNTSSDVFKK